MSDTAEQQDNVRRIERVRQLAQGDTPPRPPPTLASVVFDVPDRWSRGRHPGYGLTVPRIVAILRSAESGDTEALADLFLDVLARDAHLRAQADMVIGGVAGQPWLVRPGGDAPEDLEAAEALGAALRRVPNVRGTFAHLLSARAWGWAASEVLWDTVEGVLVPVWFEDVRHRRIAFDASAQPRLVRPDVGPDHEGLPLEPGRWLFRAHHHASLTPALAGLLVPAMWWSLFKANAARDAVLFVERYGTPTPTGTYADGTPDAEKAVLVEVVKNLGQANFGVFHESCKIQSIAPDGAGTVTQVHGDWIDRCNAEVSKLLTLGTLTSGEGTSTGSYALGAVHENGLMRTLNGEGRILGEILEQQLGLPFVRWNDFGAAKPPRIEFQVAEYLSPLDRLQIFQAAAQLGVAVDVDQFRTEMQLRPPTGESIGGPKPKPTAPTEIPELRMARRALAELAGGGRRITRARFAYDPKQPREDDGKWSEGPGGGGRRSRGGRGADEPDDGRDDDQHGAPEPDPEGVGRAIDQDIDGAGYARRDRDRPRAGVVEYGPVLRHEAADGRAYKRYATYKPDGSIELSYPLLMDVEEFRSAGARGQVARVSARVARSYATLVHEGVHACSPMTASAYEGKAMSLEEATTELVARRIMREHFGRGDVGFQVPHRRDAEGRYGDTIFDVVEAVARTKGTSYAKAAVVVEQAAHEMRRRGAGAQLATSGADYVAAFAHQISVPAEDLERALPEPGFAPKLGAEVDMGMWNELVGLKRNDLDGALAILRRYPDRGDEILPVVVRLQDDPRAILDALEVVPDDEVEPDDE